MRAKPRWTIASTLIFLLSACDLGAGAGSGNEAGRGTADQPWRYAREYLFIGGEGAEPVAATLRFEATRQDDGIARTARGAIATRGGWRSVLDARWASGTNSGVWRVIPHNGLRVRVAGGEPRHLYAGEDGGAISLQLGPPVSAWQGDERNRLRLRDGELTIGERRLQGVVLEETDASRRGRALPQGSARDLILLRGAGRRHLLLARTRPQETRRNRDFAMLLDEAGERGWRLVDVSYGAVARVAEDGPNAPSHWRFRMAGSGVEGEVRAVANTTRVGAAPRGAGRVEARSLVEGWMVQDGERVPVAGVARHEQR